MTLRENLDADFKAALKEKNELKLSVVRMVKAALMNAEISSGGKGTFDDAKILDIIRKEAKKRNDSITAYELGGRTDLAEKENRNWRFCKIIFPKPWPKRRW